MARRPGGPSRSARNLVLLLVGLALVTIAARGTYRLFVVPGMRWPLLLAGAVTLVLAVVDMARHLREGELDPAHDHAGHDHGGDAHCGEADCAADDSGAHSCADGAPGHRAPVWLLPIPAIVLLFVGPAALSPAGAAGGGVSSGPISAASTDGSGIAPLPAGEAPELSLFELSRRAVVTGPSTLDDREVTVVATVLRADGQVRLGRVVITCCAADAHLVAVRAVGPDSLRLLAPVPDGGWVRARLTVQHGSATKASGYVPAATVGAVQVVAPPEDVYEHPRR